MAKQLIIELPDWVKYATQAEDGSIWLWEKTPKNPNHHAQLLKITESNKEIIKIEESQ